MRFGRILRATSAAGHSRRRVGQCGSLTGAMQPAAFKHSDAAFNVGFALAAVQLLPHGVYIAMNGRMFAGDKAVKNMELGRFE